MHAPREGDQWSDAIVVGVVYFALYYFVFRFMITKMNLKTPGREDDSEETKLFTKADYQACLLYTSTLFQTVKNKTDSAFRASVHQKGEEELLFGEKHSQQGLF